MVRASSLKYIQKCDHMQEIIYKWDISLHKPEQFVKVTA